MHNALKKRMIDEHFHLVSIDLFSGPGGLCTGFKWAGILPLIAVEWTDTTVETYSTSHNADVLHLSEYVKDNKYLDQFMVTSTKTLLIHGDINLVDDSMIRALLQARYDIDSINETVDVVSGGAPCESFSLAGTRTIGDDRDDLFDNIVRISRTVNTKSIVFENVKGLFSKSDNNGHKGAIFQHICDTFEDANATPSYTLSSRDPNEVLLKACDYGVPQLRERVFLVAIRNDLFKKGIHFDYPSPTHGPDKQFPYVTVEEALSDLPKVEMNEDADYYELPIEFISENQKKYISIMRGLANYQGLYCPAPKHLEATYNTHSISSHKGPGHIVRKQALLSIIPRNSSMKAVYEQLKAEKKLKKKVPGYPQFTYEEIFPRTIYGSRNRRLKNDEPSYTVTSHCLDELLHPTENRAITPREAARLQSFPDWYCFAGPYVQFHGDKEQDRYEQIGDAIPPLLANAIANQLVIALPKHT